VRDTTRGRGRCGESVVPGRPSVLTAIENGDPRRSGNRRPLAIEEQDLIDALLGAAGAAAGRYLGQLATIEVVGCCGCGCPSIDLYAPSRGGEAPASPLVLADAVTPDGIQVGVILWVRGGSLSGLEVHPWDGARSVRLPRPETLTNLRRVGA
jgi:hypothetical protein